MSIEARIDGVNEKIITAYAEKLGFRPSSVAKAIVERAVETGQFRALLDGVDIEDIALRVGRKGNYRYLGKWMSARQLAEIAGISPNTMAFRLRSGWTVERAISTPVRAASERAASPSETDERRAA